MPTDVFLMILAAALVHAVWNALIKTDGDRLALIRVLSLTQLVVSVALLPFVTRPAPASWPYLCVGALLATGYMLLLNKAYQKGDLSLVYPLARGVAPLLVALVSLTLLGEELGRAGGLAVLLIGLGVTSLALTRRTVSRAELGSVLFALATGGFIASYTIIDGIGARLAQTAHGYMVWVSLLTSILTVASVLWLERGRRATIAPRTRHAGMAAGLLSYGAAWVFIWALTQAPFALVSALRETGIVFAVLIGVVLLKEPVSLARLASIAATLIGTTLLKLGR